MTSTYTFEELLHGSLDFARRQAESMPSREASLVITKLEEAVLWNDALRISVGLNPLGLSWKP